MPTESPPCRRGTLAELRLPSVKAPEHRRDSSPLYVGSFLERNEIKPNEIVDLCELGSGFGGIVYKSVHLPTGKVMARKIISNRIVSAKIRKSLAAELAALTRCVSPNVIEFYGATFSQMNISIFMEYMDLGSFERVLKIHGPIQESILAIVARSVLSGLIYLHNDLNIIHRDLKPGNILLNRKGQVKLCDFGESVELVNSLAKSLVGTTGYMAPERVNGHQYSIKSDVWSFGLTLVELATGIYPYAVPESLRTKLRPNGTNPVPFVNTPSVVELWETINLEAAPKLCGESFSPEFCHFIELALTKDHRKRPSPYDLLVFNASTRMLTNLCHRSIPLLQILLQSKYPIT